MPITYDAGTNIISVTGYTEDTPCTFEDIYQADLAGGWGVVSKLGPILYYFEARLRLSLGTSDSYLIDTNKVVVWADGVCANGAWVFIVQNRGYLRLGELVNETNKTTKNGCVLISLESTNVIYFDFINGGLGYCKVYDSDFRATTANKVRARFWGANEVVYNCSFSSLQQIMLQHSTLVLYNINLTNTQCQVVIPPASAELMKSWGSPYYLQYQATSGSSTTIKNIVGRGATTKMIQCASIDADHNIVNADFIEDPWTFYWMASSTGKVVRRYEFDLKVVDKDGNGINGATVTLYDKDNNQVFQTTTNGNGVITTQTVTYRTYKQLSGQNMEIVTFSPHRLTITKVGYQTYEKAFNLDNKTAWTIKLAKAIGIFSSFGSPVVNLKKSDPENKNVMVL